MGENILAEFSFSAHDVPAGQSISFSRLVQSTSFLDSRYIRVYNHGTDGWEGDYISIKVDDLVVLNRQSLFPRVGRNNNMEGNIVKFSPEYWDGSRYWEEQLQRIRQDL